MGKSYNQLALEFQSNKNDKVYAELYNKIKPGLLSYIVKMTKDYEAAKDILTDTMIKVYTKIHQYDSKYHITTWIYRIAHNEFLGWFDRKKKENKFRFGNDYVDFGEEIVNIHKLNFKEEDGEEDLDITVIREKDDQLQSAYDTTISEINDLPPMYRRYMIERFINNLSYKEIMSVAENKVSEELSILNSELKEETNKKKVGEIKKRIKEINSGKKIKMETVKNRIFRGRKILQDSLIEEPVIANTEY